MQDAEWAADELRITCQLCTSSCLWVGTADGILLIYDVTASRTIKDVDATPAQTNAVSGQLKLEVDLQLV